MGTAAVTPVSYVRGANSYVFKAVSTANDSTITNALLQAGASAPTTQPAGQLLTFLQTSFADEAAANAAFAAIGGQISIRADSTGTASTSALQVFWVCSTAVPALTVRAVGTTDAVFWVTVSCAQSIVT
jgi:hypothetical protein